MMNLLDGVKSAEINITKDVRCLSDQVKDKSLSLVDRIESFEDMRRTPSATSKKGPPVFSAEDATLDVTPKSVGTCLTAIRIPAPAVKPTRTGSERKRIAFPSLKEPAIHWKQP